MNARFGMKLSAVLTERSASCTLPTGEIVSVTHRVPLYTLARELNQRGYGDWLLQAHTPAGTPSLRGQVKVMAGLTVTERDKEGLRLEKYRPFPSRGRPTQRDRNTKGSPARVSETATPVVAWAAVP